MGIRRGLMSAIAVAVTALGAQFGGTAHAQSQMGTAGIGDAAVTPRSGLPGKMKSNLFAVPVKPKPVPKKVAAPAPPPPVAPRFPYRYGGWVALGNERVHYLQRGNEVVAVGKGQTLDGVWRVDALNDDRIQVSYVPLGQQLSMLLASLTGDAAPQGAAEPATVASDRHGARTPGRTLSSESVSVPAQPGATPAVPQPATPTQVAGPIGFPAAAMAQSPSRAGIGARTASITPESQAGPGSSAPTPSGKLGVEAPTSGSMPTGATRTGSSMPIGPAPAGTMPTSPAPTGRLGL